MVLDPTAREANVRDSVKKYFVDNLTPTHKLSFDKGMATPSVQGLGSAEKWVSVNWGFTEMSDMGDYFLTIYCCTRKDNEGFKLAQLRDAVMGILSDTTQTDGIRRIPFYRSYESKAWDLIGALLVTEVVESMQNTADDETKYKILTVRLKWSARI